jgi:hypothetical protein
MLAYHRLLKMIFQVNIHAVFSDGDNIYDSSWRYHPLNHDTVTVENDGYGESGKYLRVSSGFCRLRV